MAISRAQEAKEIVSSLDGKKQPAGASTRSKAGVKMTMGSMISRSSLLSSAGGGSVSSSARFSGGNLPSMPPLQHMSSSASTQSKTLSPSSFLGKRPAAGMSAIANAASNQRSTRSVRQKTGGGTSLNLPGNAFSAK